MVEQNSISPDGDIPKEPGHPSATTTSPKPRLISGFYSKHLLFGTWIIVITLGLIICVIVYFLRPPANVNPFTAKVASSVQFSLYYPTTVPPGFRIDPKSVTEPTAGVVLFDLVGPNKEKLYFSEEARPDKYNIGGFYTKFADLKEIGISGGGSIATGKLYNGSVSMGAWLNNSDWILCNTNAPVPLNQIQTMLKSLTVNF